VIWHDLPVNASPILCLVPAFYIAGAMTALIPKESVTRFLGRSAPKYVSYSAAALAGSVLAVCSCTIVPLFAGIYKKGAGLGPAITFLFFAPAANILALVYTGGVIGPDLAFARLFLSLAFGIGIGLIMALIFRREDIAHDKATDTMFAGQTQKGMSRASLAFLLILVALLLAGTLKVGLLLNSYGQATLPIPGMERIQEFLYQLVPFDAAKGEEGVTAQGAILIGLLVMIGSCKKCQTILDHLRADGYGDDRLSRIYAPIGLNLGGPTPEEIAVAILAEIIAVRRGGNSAMCSR
jgi:hypothetical protein